MNLADKYPTFFRWGRFPFRILRLCLRPIFFILVSLMTLGALFIAVENYITGKAWEKYQVEARARGKVFNITQPALPPLADDQNFMMSPLLKPIYTDGKYKEAFESRLSLEVQKNDVPKPFPATGFGAWAKGERVDLSQWAAYFQQPDMFVALKKYDADVAEISSASRKPYSRFSVQYDRPGPVARRVTPETALALLSRIYELRTLAELNAGQNQPALDDAITILRMAQADKDEPSYNGPWFTGDVLRKSTLQVVWEGLAANRWNAAQLAVLQQEMQKIDLFAQYQQVRQTGQNIDFVFIEWLKQQSIANRYKFFKKQWHLNTFSLGDILAVVPDYIWTQAELDVSRHDDEDIAPCVEASLRRINLPAIQAARRASEEAGQRATSASVILHPQRLVDSIVGVASFNSEELYKFAQAQSGLDEAVVACALERFKIVQGDYPATLDELVPQFIAKVPNDVVSGKPLHYQRTANGRYMLAAVGWNEKDNDGKWTATFSDESWAWQYAATK